MPFTINLQKKVYLCTLKRDVSSVGLERCFHTAEVTSSNPVRPTFFMPFCFQIYIGKFSCAVLSFIYFVFAAAVSVFAVFAYSVYLWCA